MVRPFPSPAMTPVAPYRGPATAATYQAAAAALRREALAERDQRNRERRRNLWRAVMASGLLILALGSAFLAGANSGAVSGLFASKPSPYAQSSLSAADVKRGELRIGKVLFTLPDGETCRPMHFDNVTGEMSPGVGLVPCVTDNSRPQGSGRFGWRKN